METVNFTIGELGGSKRMGKGIKSLTNLPFIDPRWGRKGSESKKIEENP